MTFWLSLRRLAYITFVITKHVVAHACGMLLAHLPGSFSPRSYVRLSGPDRLRAALEELGGSFIKFGQMLALQPDILSLEYCNALFDLLDRITPFDHTDVEQIFVEEVGKTPSEIFDSFEICAYSHRVHRPGPCGLSRRPQSSSKSTKTKCRDRLRR